MPDLVQNHSIRGLNPSATITSPMIVHPRSEHLNNPTSHTERENSYRRHEVDQLIHRSEESYSDLSQRTRIDRLGQHEATDHLNLHSGKSFKIYEI